MQLRSACALVFVLSGGASALAAPRTVTLDVPGMTCPTCPIAIRTVLLKQAGVSAVVVHYGQKQLDVAYDDSKITPAAITGTTASIGFPSQVHAEHGQPAK